MVIAASDYRHGRSDPRHRHIAAQCREADAWQPATTDRSREQFRRSDNRFGGAAPAARHRRGDGRGDAAHLLFADPQFQPRFLHRDLRHQWPPDRAGRACADPCRRAALGGEGGARVLRRRHPSRRRVPAERSLSWRQPSARSDRLRAGLRGRETGVLVDQPRAPERHRRLHARRLQRRRPPRSGRRASASRRCGSTTAAWCGATCWKCWRPTCATRTIFAATSRR